MLIMLYEALHATYGALNLLVEPYFSNALFSLVSHYSAIGDTISCDAPYSAIGFRGKLPLR